MKVAVRQATPEDSAFAFEVTEESMRTYVESTWGVWEPVAQLRAHAASFSPASHWLVFAGEASVGIVAAELHSSHVQLLKLYLREASRGQGIGALVLSALLRSAASRAQPLRLRVLAVNTRAQSFYARHGFLESFRTIERVFMEAKPVEPRVGAT